MKNWIKNLFNEKEEKEILQWQSNASILEFLRKNLDTKGLLKESASTLPDEKKADDEVKFAAGLMDSMIGADNSEKSKTIVKKLFAIISKISNNGDEQSKSDFYREIIENENVISIIDDFLQKLVQSSLSVDPYLYNYAYDLATKTNNRNSVKFGIAILGLCQNKEPIEDIKLLGLHDEFTVFSTIALSSLSDNLINDLYQLAQKVDGWGKIQLVDRLAEMELTDEIRDWLILEGYKNSIMYEYLALTCAINGKLNKKLQNESINQHFFDAAGDIIATLMNEDESPADGISAYHETEETIQNYIRHAKSMSLKISDFITLHKIKDYLENLLEENEPLKNWNLNDLSNSLIDLKGLLSSKDWTKEVKISLESSDKVEFWNGKQAAKKLGMDISEILWARLDKFPLESISWYDITNDNTTKNPQKVVDKAIELLPIKELSTGPEDSMGLGANWQKYQSLDCVITFLENYPRVGEEIIVAGLNSPVIRNRYRTLKTLQSWTSSNWNEKIKAELNILLEAEPTSDIKSDLVKLLNGKEI